MHVGACVQQYAGDVDYVCRKRFVAIRVAGNVMQQRRGAEVTVRRIQVRARVNERPIRCQQGAQAIDVAVIEGGQRGVEARMRLDPLDLSGLLDAALQIAPVAETVFPRDNELRVRKSQRLVEHRAGRPFLHLRMMRGDASCGGDVAIAMRTPQLVRLNLELVETRTWRESSSRHARSFRERPMSAVRAERSGDSNTTTN